MQRSHARSPRGQRAYGRKPGSKPRNISIIAALSLAKGLHLVTQLPKALNGDLFIGWVAQVLAPTLRPGQVVVLDNASPHKVQCVRAIVETVGCRLIFTPPYSPWYNPIEESWSKVKAYLRKVRARTKDTVMQSLREAVRLIDPIDVDNWFAHALQHRLHS